MGWICAIYFVFFTLLSVAGLWDDYRDKQPAWFIALAVLSNTIIAYLLIAYYVPGLRLPMRVPTKIAFVASMAWELFSATMDVRGLSQSPETSEGSQLGRAIVISFILFLLCLPAFVLAGMSAYSQ